jgi:glycosyltransferase involved in cell wall biosynthesis
MTLINNFRIKALISTIEPVDGGVPSMTRWICQQLESINIEPILAWYAPCSNYPSLSIPFYSLYTGLKPGLIHQTVFNRYTSYGIGCWLPELEFTHYLPNNYWNKLICECDIHIAVSGNVLCALPYLKKNIPFIAWVATPWEADRKDRIRKFVLPRRLLDAIMNKPVLKRFEKKILESSNSDILCLSNYTYKELNQIAPKVSKSILYMPVNTNLFDADHDRTKPWRIGFSGRYTDPRKNIELLLLVTQILLRRCRDIELVLVGDRKADIINDLISKYSLESTVTIFTHLYPAQLAKLLQTFDVFVIPSHQEGLCIAALEAMACGVPIVSTRCGGPEDYVRPGITGFLCDSNPEEFADMIEDICSNRQKRSYMSTAAVEWIKEYASDQASKLNFLTHLSLYLDKKGIPLRL